MLLIYFTPMQVSVQRHWKCTIFILYGNVCHCHCLNRLQVKLAPNEELRAMAMGEKEMNVCQHVSCLKPQTLKTVHRTHFGFNALLFHSFLCNVCQIRVFDARASSFACTRHSKNTRVFVCVCVCVCVCVHVYVVYEDTNLYNDIGMT